MGQANPDSTWSRGEANGRVSPGPRLVIDLHGATLNGADLTRADLRNSNFENARAPRVNFENTDMAGANLRGTVLRGANLGGVRNLTVEQLREAVIDEHTVLPDYIDRAALLGE